LLAKSKRAEGTSPNIIGEGAETTQIFFVKLKKKCAGKQTPPHFFFREGLEPFID
jgi:hypothetical protein